MYIIVDQNILHDEDPSDRLTCVLSASDDGRVRGTHRVNLLNIGLQLTVPIHIGSVSVCHTVEVLWCARAHGWISGSRFARQVRGRDDREERAERGKKEEKGDMWNSLEQSATQHS